MFSWTFLQLLHGWPLSYTLNVHVNNVVVVLDAMLNLAAVGPRVTGSQLRQLYGSICRGSGVGQQVDSVQIALTDQDLSFQGHEDGRDFFFGHMAPFDAMRKGCNGGSPRVWDCVVLYIQQNFQPIINKLKLDLELEPQTLNMHV